MFVDKNTVEFLEIYPEILDKVSERYLTMWEKSDKYVELSKNKELQLQYASSLRIKKYSKYGNDDTNGLKIQLNENEFLMPDDDWKKYLKEYRDRKNEK